VPQAADAAVAALLEGPGAAMNKFNRIPKPAERADDGSSGSPAAARGGTGGGRSRPPD